MDLEPIGYVTSPRTEALDDDWDGIVSTITVDGQRFTPASLAGLEDLSHVEVVDLFDRSTLPGFSPVFATRGAAPPGLGSGSSPSARRTAPTAWG